MQRKYAIIAIRTEFHASNHANHLDTFDLDIKLSSTKVEVTFFFRNSWKKLSRISFYYFDLNDKIPAAMNSSVISLEEVPVN